MSKFDIRDDDLEYVEQACLGKCAISGCGNPAVCDSPYPEAKYRQYKVCEKHSTCECGCEELFGSVGSTTANNVKILCKKCFFNS